MTVHSVGNAFEAGRTLSSNEYKTSKENVKFIRSMKRMNASLSGYKQLCKWHGDENCVSICIPYAYPQIGMSAVDNNNYPKSRTFSVLRHMGQMAAPIIDSSGLTNAIASIDWLSLSTNGGRSGVARIYL